MDRSILDYIARGWYVIPIPTRRKAPLISAWPDLRISQREAQSYFSTASNVGVLLGVESGGLYLVDVDLDSQAAIANAPQFLPDTGCIFGRPSKPSSHRLYYVREPVDTKQFRDNQKRMICEIRGRKAQTVFPPSIHPSGEKIEWEMFRDPPVVALADLLTSIESLCAACEQPLPPADEQEAAPRSSHLERCIKYLSKVPDSIAGQRGHDSALRSICEIFRFGLDDGEAQTAADWFNGNKCEPVWSAKELAHKLRDAKKIVIEAGQFGMRTREPEFVPPATVRADCKPTPHKRWPGELLSPPGLLGDLCAWMNETAPRPQPLLSFGASLAFLAALFGRKVRTTENFRTNLYVVGTAPSGAGKEHARKAIKKLCQVSNLTDRVLGPDEISSSGGLLREVASKPSMLILYDEIGHFFGIANSANASTHQREISVVLTKLYTCSDHSFGGRGQAAGTINSIQEPNLCIYGTSQADSLFDGLKKYQIEDGFAGRILFLQTTPDQWDTPVRTVPPLESCPQSIVDLVTRWFAKHEGTPTGPFGQALIVPTVGSSADVHDIRMEYRQKFEALKRANRGNGLDALWARAEEVSMKLALICAAGCNFERPEITGDIFDWAARVVSFSSEAFAASVMANMADSEFGKQKLKIVQAIRRSGGQVTHSQLVCNRATRDIPARARKECIDDLLEGGQIARVTLEGQSTARAYRLLDKPAASD